MSETNNKKKVKNTYVNFELVNKIFIDVFVSLVALLLRIKNLLRIICSTHIYVIKTQYFLKTASPNHHYLFQDLHYVTESFCHFHKLEKHEDQTVTITHFKCTVAMMKWSTQQKCPTVGRGSGIEHFSWYKI